MDNDPHAPVGRPDVTNKPAREMTRGQQTFWIIAAMTVIFGFWYGYEKRRDPTDPYAQCWPFYDTACKADVAAERIRLGIAE